jgi:hypothetical protein
MHGVFIGCFWHGTNNNVDSLPRRFATVRRTRVSRKKNTQKQTTLLFSFYSFVPSIVPQHVFTGSSDAANATRCDQEFPPVLYFFLLLFSDELFVNTAVGPSFRSLLVASRTIQIPTAFRVRSSSAFVTRCFRAVPLRSVSCRACIYCFRLFSRE